MRDTVYFVSDAHFGLDTDERERLLFFQKLVAVMRKRAAAVYFVGDMFAFWIEYGQAIRPGYFLILHELRKLVEDGVEVHYLAGNHDFALGSFLEKTIGVRIHRGSIDVELQGRRIHINHGDRLNRGRVLRFVDRMLHNESFQKLYRMIHPNIGVWIGTRFSALTKSKNRNRAKPLKEIKKYRRAACKLIKSQKCNLVILAHTHHADYVKFEDGGEYCNTGAWMDKYDYAALHDGAIQLLKWSDTPPTLRQT